MAPHELSIRAEDGEAEMFYVGPEPWHRQGTRLQEPATAKEAIIAAHLDWEVELQPLVRQEGWNVYKSVPDKYAIVRKDTDVTFALVSGEYQIVQNAESFDLFEDVIGQGQAVYHTAGALREGRVVFILAKLPDTLEVVKNDPIDKYILLSTSHDRTKSLEMSITPIRVVCMNTLRFALSRATHRIKIRHTGRTQARAVEAREALSLNDAYYQTMMAGLERLVQTPMSTDDMKTYSLSFLNANPETAEDKLHAYTVENMDRLCDLFETGMGQDIPGVRGTAYAALNATTEFLDNFKRVTVEGGIRQDDLQAQDKRLYNSWFGRGQSHRDTAFTLLQKYSAYGSSAFEGTYLPRKRRIRRPQTMAA